jgi:hypothetical protein
MSQSKLKQFFWDLIYNKEVAKLSREKKFISFSNALSIGILYDVGDEEEYKRFTSFASSLQSERKEIKALGYVKYNLIPHYCYPKLSFDYIIKKNISWYGKPSGEFVKDFISRDFDILINLNLNENPVFQYICGLSHAKFKIGKYSPENEKYLDFMLEVENDLSVDDFIKKLMEYWNIFVDSK